jgi:hypothetical protein
VAARASNSGTRVARRAAAIRLGADREHRAPVVVTIFSRNRYGSAGCTGMVIPK